MAGGYQSEGDDILASINVTPLVDIMLVLLIIFMVTTTFMLSPSIPVNLPKAASAEGPPIKAFAVVMDKDGALYVNGNKSSPEQTMEKLKIAVSENSDIQAILAADGEVPYQSVIWMIDLIKESGVKNFALNVQKVE